MIRQRNLIIAFAMMAVLNGRAGSRTVQVRGTVTDADGAAVSAAAVSYISLLTNDTTTAVTDKAGRYSLTLQLFPATVSERRPADYKLLQSFPNPFNPSTTIVADLPKGSEVDLAVYNLRGERVARLFSGALPAGRHFFRWDGRDDRGLGVAAGLYFCRLTAPDLSAVHKMALVDGSVSGTGLVPPLAKASGEVAFKIVVRKDALRLTAEEQFLIDSARPEIEKNLTLPALKALAAVDRSIGYQTIEGFGGYGGFAGWYNSPEFVDMLLNDLSLTMLRTNIPPSLEAVNDDDDPNHFNWEGFKVNGSGGEYLGNRIEYLKAMSAAGVKIISTVWSPPGWMKKSGQTAGKREAAPDPATTDCSLKDDMFEEFAEFIAAYIILMKREAGIDVYAVSLQNEPAFEEPYDSCVYSPEKLAALIAVVGARLEREGLSTKIFSPEDLGYHERVMRFVNAGMNNDQARRYIGANAVHGYALDGKTGQGYQALQWRQLYEAGAPYGIPLWMTETSGFSNDWNGAMKMAQAIHFALYYGKISAWLHWSLSVSENFPDSYPYGLIIGLNMKTARYHVSKQYYKFIRPGMVQRAASAFDPDVLIAAFQDEKTDKWAIVLINRAAVNKTVTLVGEGLPSSLSLFRTSPYEDCRPIGTVRLNEPMTLLGDSISTLVKE